MHSINVVRRNRRLQTCGEFHHYYSLEEPLFDLKRRYLLPDLLSIWKRMACLCEVRRPGVARQASNFLSRRRKKVTKERATPSLRPLRCATGQPAAGRLWGGMGVGAPMLRALTRRGCPSGAAQQRSELCGAPRKHPAAGAARRGVKPNTGHRCARPPALGRAQRWPVRMSDSRVPFRMRRGAQRPADQGSRLFERNAVKRVRARPRWTRAPQVARSEAQGRSL